MSGDGKKISFSFSKVKKPALNKSNVESKPKVDYVDCFDGSEGKFSYKGNVKSEPEKKELVIPMPSTKTSLDIIKSKIEEKNETKSSQTNKETEEKLDESKKNKTLEELAVSEILKDVNNTKSEKDSNDLIIDSKDSTEVKEASEFDIDYDNIPVSDFGLAMLRGMGWKPNAGIGKMPKLVPTVSPKLRPKGLGLGAKPVPESNDQESKVK